MALYNIADLNYIYKENYNKLIKGINFLHSGSIKLLLIYNKIV